MLVAFQDTFAASGGLSSSDFMSGIYYILLLSGDSYTTARLRQYCSMVRRCQPRSSCCVTQVSICIAIMAFAAVNSLKLFEPAVVLGGGVLGICAWAAKMD